MLSDLSLRFQEIEIVKIGFNMLLWSSNIGEEHFPLLQTMKDVGYDGVEFFLGEPEIEHHNKVGAELQRLGLGCTTVTCPPPEANPVSPDATARAAGLDHMKWAIDATAALGGDTLGGPFHSAYKVFTGKGPTDDERKWCADVMREAAIYAQGANITLATEVINRFECYMLNTGAQAQQLCDMVDQPNFGYLYDTHHSNIEEKSIADAIATGKKHIKLVHISECDRGAPGTGVVDWDTNFKTLKEIEYDGWMTIEAFSPDDPDFAAAIHVWREYDSKEEIYAGGYKFIKDMLAKHNF
ncbi:MAG: sugar phosphate isomerase/epimerase family protein [Phycisphaeraceae bacterium]